MTTTNNNKRQNKQARKGHNTQTRWIWNFIKTSPTTITIILTKKITTTNDNKSKTKKQEQ